MVLGVCRDIVLPVNLGVAAARVRQLSINLCSEKDLIYLFKASRASRQEKYENISLKRTAFTLLLTFTNVPFKVIKQKEDMHLHSLSHTIVSGPNFSARIPLSSFLWDLKCDVSKTPGSSFSQYIQKCLTKPYICAYIDTFIFFPPEMSYTMVLLL